MPASVKVLKMNRIDHFCLKLAIGNSCTFNVHQGYKTESKVFFGLNLLLLK